jgi:predicted RNA binding protein YcfA (HicA-like mRNA interferase family)
MTKKRKLLAKILNNQKNVSFDDMVTLVEAFGFYQSRVGGSHHVFEHSDIPELVNLQNQKSQAKSYQIRQFLTLLEQYNLTLQDAGEEE